MLEAYQSGEIIGLFQKDYQWECLILFISLHLCQFAVSDKYNLINKDAPKITKSIINEIKNKILLKIKKTITN